MAKKLSRSDIAHKAQRWARHMRDAATRASERERDKKIIALRSQLEELEKPYSDEIEKLEAKAEVIYDEIIEWLEQQKKPLTIETKNAIAQLLKGTRPGNRVADPQKFIALCKKKKVDPWDAINVVLKLAEPKVGKHAFDEICAKAEIEFTDATLTLK